MKGFGRKDKQGLKHSMYTFCVALLLQYPRQQGRLCNGSLVPGVVQQGREKRRRGQGLIQGPGWSWGYEKGGREGNGRRLAREVKCWSKRQVGAVLLFSSVGGWVEPHLYGVCYDKRTAFKKSDWICGFRLSRNLLMDSGYNVPLPPGDAPIRHCWKTSPLQSHHFPLQILTVSILHIFSSCARCSANVWHLASVSDLQWWCIHKQHWIISDSWWEIVSVLNHI